MTVTDFTLMAVLVIVITFSMLRAVEPKNPIERGICLLGGVTFTVFAMAVLSAVFREEVKVATLAHGSYAVQELPNNSDYLVTEVSPGADKALYKLDDVDAPVTGLEQDLDLVVYKTESMIFSFIDTYPGLLKYLSQASELAPLLDFWEELRVIRGGLL